MHFFIWIIGAVFWTLILTQERVHSRLQALASHDWQLIGKVQGVVDSQGPWVEVTKWQSSQGMQLRFYINHFDQTADQESSPMQIIELPRGFDGHVWFKEVYSNLAITNADKQGASEVVVPFYDLKLNPRLFVYRYDPVIRQFILLNDQGL